jgi:hypothetical protein
MDFDDVVIKAVRWFDDQMYLNIDLPILEHWEINAKQEVNTWLIPANSDIQLVFKNFDIDVKTGLRVNDNGFIDFPIKEVRLNFGDSYLYHENWFVAFVMHQFVYFSVIMIENSAWFVGEYVFSKMLGPVIDEFMNDYKKRLTIKSPFKGQSSASMFEFDFRNTWNPAITEDNLDFFFLGAVNHIGVKGQRSECNIEPSYLDFDDEKTSQLIISEDAASCFAKSISESTIGTLHLNT